MTSEVDIIKEIGEKRYEHIKNMKTFAMKQGKCKELHEGVCSYPHCQCLFIGLEEEQTSEQ